MKNLNTTGYNKTLLDWALLAIRIFVGLGMLTHGFPKLMQLLGGSHDFINFFGIRSQNISYFSSSCRSSLFTFLNF